MSMRDQMERTYRQRPEYCRDVGWYRQRNEKALRLVEGGQYGRVVELASGSGLLAEMFLAAHGECEEYICTDYAPTAIRLATEHCIGHRSFNGFVRDAEEVPLGHADLVLCTSIDYLWPGCEARYLRKMRQGAEAVFATSSLESPAREHINVCPSLNEAVERVRQYAVVLGTDFHDCPVTFARVFILHLRREEGGMP